MRGFRIRVALMAIAGSAGFAASSTPAALAGSIVTVTTHADEFGDGSECSLREAVQSTNIGAPFGGCSFTADPNILTYTVDLQPGPTPYLLTRPGVDDDNSGGDLDVLAGTGIRATLVGRTDPAVLFQAATIEAQGTGDRVIDVPPGRPTKGFLTLNLLNITGGQSDAGGGVRVVDSFLSMNYVSVFANRATVGPDAVGGGVAVYSDQNQNRIGDSTISGNVANGAGGGLYIDSPFGGPSGSTIAGNVARADGVGSLGGGGIALGPNGRFLAAPTHMLLASNSDLGSGAAPDCAGTIGSQGWNLLGDRSGCGYSPQPTDIVGVADPGLAPLGDAGGFFQMHALLPGSPAIDAGETAAAGSRQGGPEGTECWDLDERGVLREQALPCDIGAWESAQCGDRIVNEIGAPAFEVFGTASGDGFLGTESGERMSAGEGDDAVCAGAGDDVVSAGTGDDEADGEAGDDRLTLQSGDDIAAGGDGEDRLSMGRGDDVGKGGAGRDTETGGAGADRLLGNGGGDVLKGGPGPDILNGGPGHDVCIGNGGEDVARNCERTELI